MPAATVPCEELTKRDKAAKRAGEVLRRGGLVVFPTETVYGVAACLTSERGLARLRELKDQDPAQPFTIHVPDRGAIERYVDLDEHPVLRRLVRKTMPGPITMLVTVSDATIAKKSAAMKLGSDVARLIYHDHQVALRCPDHPAAAAMLGAIDEPVVAAGASIDGSEPHTADAAQKQVGEKVDLILDGGPTRYSKPSTVVRVEGDAATVIRPGVFDQRYIDKLTRLVLLFVCSGNTCRSPMAEAIARDELARRGETRVDVVSAGAMAIGGMPMSPEAAQALRKINVESAGHVSRPLTPSLAAGADVIFCMTSGHLLALREIAPESAGKAMLLDPGECDIEDPIGAGRNIYVECAQRIGELIRRRLDELGLRGRR